MQPTEQVIRELRRHYEGILVFGDGRTCEVRFIIDPASGRLLMPVEPAAANAESHTLYVPQEREGAVQALLTLSEADERGDAGAACDRWQAYHAAAERAAGSAKLVWSWGVIEATKYQDQVCDGGEVMLPNPLRAIEPRLCRELNQRRDDLAVACQRVGGVEVTAPLAVGVDNFGLDVRARFGIVRLEYPDAAVMNEAAAPEAIQRLLGQGERA